MKNTKINVNWKELQQIVMGECYREGTINRAIEYCNKCEKLVEPRTLLIALRNGVCSFESRMALQSFIVSNTTK
jgi:hypothetical protein